MFSLRFVIKVPTPRGKDQRYLGSRVHRSGAKLEHKNGSCSSTLQLVTLLVYYHIHAKFYFIHKYPHINWSS